MLRSARNPLIASGIAAIVAFIPRAMTAGHFQHVDEIRWMERSAKFGDALRALDLPAASATTGDTATMPGLTTMWLGTIARGAWSLGRSIGIVDDQGPFAVSAAGLHLSQLAMAFATSVVIGLLVLLAWRWAGAIAAIVAGSLLATEPFLVAHGAVLHTDELAALLGATGSLALLLALGVPDRAARRRRLMAVLAGATLAGALLTKLSALLLAPGLAAVVAWALVRAGIRARAAATGTFAGMRPTGGLLGIAFAAGVVTTALAWPAIWADPVNQVRLLRASADLAGEGHRQFFLGDVTDTPGPLFYLVATPFRMTPWFLLGTVAVIAAAIARATRPRLVVLAIVAIPAFVGISLASKQIDRYVLVVVPFLALAIGVGFDALWARLRRRLPATRAMAAVAAAAIVMALVHTAWIAPWGRAFFNPLLGGGQVAERTILVGGGEGLELAGELIRRREAPDCDVTIAVLPAIPSAFPCGSLAPVIPLPAFMARPGDRSEPGELPDPDYLVIYVNHRQRVPDALPALRASGRRVATVTVRGIEYAEIIDRREPAGGGRGG